MLKRHYETVKWRVFARVYQCNGYVNAIFFFFFCGRTSLMVIEGGCGSYAVLLSPERARPLALICSHY